VIATSRPLVSCLAALAVIAFAATAGAESGGPEARVERLHERALEAYSNMEMDEALSLLQRTLQVARRQDIGGPLLARVHITYGTVLILGHGRLADGREHLVTAARESDEVEPDPMLSTPLLEQVWLDVIAEVRPRAGGEEPPPDDSLDPGDPDEPPPTFGQGRLVHTPVREQLADHAVPIYVELQQTPEIRRILLAYRAPGMAGWLSVDMGEHGDGFAARIPCHRVTGDYIDYFITVTTAEEGPQLEGGGSRDDPFRVTIGEGFGGAPPHLPGEDPEPPCSEDSRSGRETPLDQRDRLFYVEAQVGTGAGVPFGEQERTCDAGQDRVRISPSPSWTELVILPELGFYIGRHVSLGVRARLQVPGAVFIDAPFHWGVMLRARWFVIPEDPIRVFAHLGAGYAEISHRVELQVGDGSVPVCGAVHYQPAGPGVVALGAGILWDVHRNFAVGADFTLSMFVPDFALQGDLALVLNASF